MAAGLILRQVIHSKVFLQFYLIRHLAFVDTIGGPGSGPHEGKALNCDGVCFHSIVMDPQVQVRVICNNKYLHIWGQYLKTSLSDQVNAMQLKKIFTFVVQ